MGWANWWRASVGPVAAICVCLPLVACASLATKAQSRGGDTVTQWTLIADDYGNGAANWRTLAIMQMAMHDALNAADPIYRRWWPATADEPPPGGASPEVAMASAALEVLRNLHPTREEEILAAFADVMARYPDDASKVAGERLGSAIGRAALARRSHDGFDGEPYMLFGGETTRPAAGGRRRLRVRDEKPDKRRSSVPFWFCPRGTR